jgi:hypothetical protein
VSARVEGVRWSAALRWLSTFLGFPAGGLAAELIVGPVDGVVPALLGGGITGAILGLVQWWGLGPAAPPPRRWVAASAGSLAIGLAVGSGLVGHGTGTGELMLQGAVCGLAIGTAQGALLPRRVGLVWAPALAALWALGWAITASIGVDVESRYTVFGSSGAVVVTALTAALPVALGSRRRS